jgi:hypothetical protein
VTANSPKNLLGQIRTIEMGLPGPQAPPRGCSVHQGLEGVGAPATNGNLLRPYVSDSFWMTVLPWSCPSSSSACLCLYAIELTSGWIGDCFGSGTRTQGFSHRHTDTLPPIGHLSTDIRRQVCLSCPPSGYVLCPVSSVPHVVLLQPARYEQT